MPRKGAEGSGGGGGDAAAEDELAAAMKRRQAKISARSEKADGGAAVPSQGAADPSQAATSAAQLVRAGLSAASATSDGARVKPLGAIGKAMTMPAKPAQGGAGPRAGSGGLPANKDAAIRAGKREAWRWEVHEAVELGRRVEQGRVDNKGVFLWAFDDICLAHTKRRVVKIDGDFNDLKSLKVTSIAESAADTIAGLKQMLRHILHGHPKGLKESQVTSAYKDKTDTTLDDDTAISLGFASLDHLLRNLPDALTRHQGEHDRWVGTRPATRHEVQTWLITGGGAEVPGATYVVEEGGGVLAVRAGERGPAELPPVVAPIGGYLPYDDSVVYEDLTEMRKIHLASLLHNVEHRFLSEKVYSYIGNMLLAINPYKTLTMPVPGIRDPCGYYDVQVRSYYARLRGETRLQGVRAHIFVIADMAFRALSGEGKNQSVVISGESGAGKTKSAREILRYIVEVASGAFDGPLDGSRSKDADAIVSKITVNNPILEAFGNAKTLRNDNSSRFGKYLELCFDRGGRELLGARIQTYLLEKSRLIHQSRGERNFHVFYMLLEGLGGSEEARKALRLKSRDEYKYLGGVDGTFVAEGAYEDELSEAQQWVVLENALREMGVDGEQASVRRVLSFVLLLGNLEFEDRDVSGTPHGQVTASTRRVLEDASHVLMCDSSSLEEALVIKKDDKLFGRVPLNASQAASNRDSLAKVLYNELFDWIRSSINRELSLEASSQQNDAMGDHTVGLLDIFGFESFTVFDAKAKVWRTANSLEQLCINFANESLQMLFNQKVLESDKRLYESEFDAGDLPDIQLDNRGYLCLANMDMVFTKLWDACREAERRDEYDKMGREMLDVIKKVKLEEPGFATPPPNSSQSDARKWKQTEERRYFPNPTSFVITHYADDVEYSVTGMIEKNIDKGHQHLKTLVVSSGEGGAAVKEPLVVWLLQKGLGVEGGGGGGGEGEGGGRQARTRTVAGLFKEQLTGSKGLIPTLEGTHMHFVRCVKPNDVKKPLMFEKPKVAGQLSSNGVVEAVKLAQAGGLPTRYAYTELWERSAMDLQILLRAKWRREGNHKKDESLMLDARQGMKEVLDWLGREEWRDGGVILSTPSHWQVFQSGQGSYKFGKKMLFLAAGKLGQLQMLRSFEMAPFACLLQAAVRRTHMMSQYRSMLGVIDLNAKARKIQRWWRSTIHRIRTNATRPTPRRSPAKPSSPPPPPPPPPRPPSPPPWPPKGMVITQVTMHRARLPGAPPSAPCGLGLMLGGKFPFAIEGLAPGGAAETSGLLLTGDQIIEVDGTDLKTSTLDALRSLVAGPEGTAVCVSVLRKEGVTPDVEVTHPYSDADSVNRLMIKSITSIENEEDPDKVDIALCLDTHNLLSGMYVRVTVPLLPHTHPLQGVHRISTATPLILRVKGQIPDDFDGKSLIPADLYTAPSYVVRVPSPNILSSSPSKASPSKNRNSVPPRGTLGADGVVEFVCAYKTSTQNPRDVPPSVREGGGDSLAEFWEKAAPKRDEFQLAYPTLRWSDFKDTLLRECDGGEGSLFGKFALSEFEQRTEELHQKLADECQGGVLPVVQGHSVVPPSALAAVAKWAEQEGPPPPSDAIAALYPPWIAAFLPPHDAGDAGGGGVGAVHQLIKFGEGGEMMLDGGGLGGCTSAGREGTGSRVVAVIGRAGAGKSMLCRLLLQSALPENEDTLYEETAPCLAPSRNDSVLTTSGVECYQTSLKQGHIVGGGGGGYSLPVRLLDTEGETEELGVPTGCKDGFADTLADCSEAATLSSLQCRQDAVQIGIPRLAYLTSDVLVYVTRENIFTKAFHSKLQQLAQVSSGGVGRPGFMPSLLIVSNLNTRDERDYKHTVADQTEEFMKQHMRKHRYTPSQLFGGANETSLKELPLTAFFSEVRAMRVPVIPSDLTLGTRYVEFVQGQVQRFQAEVHRLAAKAPGSLAEKTWPTLLSKCVSMALWKDPLTTAESARLTISPPRTMSPAVQQSFSLFQYAAMVGDARRANPLPGSVPPRRVMHVVFEKACEVAVDCLAAAVVRERSNGRGGGGGGGDAEEEFGALLKVMAGWQPCEAADPYSGSAIAKSGMHACCKVRRDYDWSGSFHWRPVTGYRGLEGPSARWEAADRVFGSSANVTRLTIYTEQHTQSVTGESLRQVVISSAANQGLEKCEITTLHPHHLHEGYIACINIRGVDPRASVHAAPKRVLEVRDETHFTVSGQVPTKINGMPLENLIFGRSKAERANGSFVSTISWNSLARQLRARFEEKLGALKSADEAANAMQQCLKAAEDGVKVAQEKSTIVFSEDEAATWRRREEVCRAMGLAGVV